MDLATVIGFVVTFGILVWSMLAGGNLSVYWDTPSFILVAGGTLFVVVASFPLRTTLSVFAVMRKVLFNRLPSITEEIDRMAKFALLAQREGFLALEEKLKEVEDPLLSKGLKLIVDGFPMEAVRAILEADIDAMKDRHSNGKKVIDTVGYYGPALGMLGTLIGLVAMLVNLNDPSKIGAGMAVALLTTFYGCLIANIICLPIATKLDIRSKEEGLLRAVIIEGIASIQAGDKPQLLKEKLKAFLSPVERRVLLENAPKPQTAAM